MQKLRDKLNNAIRKYKEEYKNNALLDFINEELSTDISDKDYQELLDLIPILMENTDRANYRWVDNHRLYEMEGFIEKLIDNLDKFDFDKINFNGNILTLLLKNVPRDRIFTDKFMLNLDLTNINAKNYLKVYRNYKNYNGDKAYSLLTDGLLLYNNPEIVKAITKTLIEYDRIDIICQNIDKIIECYDDLFELNAITKDNKKANDKVKKYIENNEKGTVAGLLSSHIIDEYITYNGKLLKRENYSSLELRLEEQSLTEIMYLIIKEICENENVKISDIYQIGKGSYSEAIEIGNKILEIGADRITPKFHNNPYIIQPLLRRKFTIGHFDQSMYIDINEKVDTMTKVTEEELYQLYKKVRKIGLIWTDVGVRNVGRLIKDNTIHWNKTLEPSDKALNLDEYIDGPKLKVGDIVILDKDSIYKEDTDEEYPRTQIQIIFEERYQREKYMEELEQKRNK